MEPSSLPPVQHPQHLSQDLPSRSALATRSRDEKVTSTAATALSDEIHTTAGSPAKSSESSDDLRGGSKSQASRDDSATSSHEGSSPSRASEETSRPVSTHTRVPSWAKVESSDEGCIEAVDGSSLCESPLAISDFSSEESSTNETPEVELTRPQLPTLRADDPLTPFSATEFLELRARSEQAVLQATGKLTLDDAEWLYNIEYQQTDRLVHGVGSIMRSRFPLSSQRFIHANRVPMASGDDYIMTQYPSPNRGNMQELFWTMVHESTAATIVNLAQLDGQMRTSYWPEPGDKLTFDSITVEGLKVETRDDPQLTIRHFQVSGPNGTKQVSQVHIDSWIDHDVVEAEFLVKAICEVDKVQGEATDPVIVHCTAGIGRAGTFVASRELQRRIIERDRQARFIYTSKAEVADLVLHIRTHRQHRAVETLEQLKLVTDVAKYCSEIGVITDRGSNAKAASQSNDGSSYD